MKYINLEYFDLENKITMFLGDFRITKETTKEEIFLSNGHRIGVVKKFHEDKITLQVEDFAHKMFYIYFHKSYGFYFYNKINTRLNIVEVKNSSMKEHHFTDSIVFFFDMNKIFISDRIKKLKCF